MKKILVLDDEPTAMFYVWDALEGAGYDVTRTRTREEVIRCFNADHYDLVILDRMIPPGEILTGADYPSVTDTSEQLLRDLCERFHLRSVPVIVLTSYPNDEEVEQIKRTYQRLKVIDKNMLPSRFVPIVAAMIHEYSLDPTPLIPDEEYPNVAPYFVYDPFAKRDIRVHFERCSYNEMEVLGRNNKEDDWVLGANFAQLLGWPDTHRYVYKLLGHNYQGGKVIGLYSSYKPKGDPMWYRHVLFEVAPWAKYGVQDRRLEGVGLVMVARYLREWRWRNNRISEEVKFPSTLFDENGVVLEGARSSTDFLESIGFKHDNSIRMFYLSQQDAQDLLCQVSRLPIPSKRLIDACVANQCVLYVGAGLSTAAGPPTWKALVDGLLNWATLNGYLSQEIIISCQQALVENDIDTVADTLVSHLQEQRKNEELIVYLREQFLGAEKRPDARTELLRELNLAGVLTTNFDDLLEQTFQLHTPTFTPHDTEALLDALSKHNFFLGKLYGTLDRPDTVLVAPMQYQEAVAGNVRFANFVQGLFISRTLFFIGCSLDGIEAYLRGIRMMGQPKQTHFALVNVENGAWRARADLLKRRYGIEVIAYTATEGFPEAQQFLEALRDAVQTKLAQKRLLESAGHTETVPSWLKRVELKNIGPFESLELDLDRNWQALLGDNGQGKSTILRAIAVGICGEDARYYAKRLIRYGCTSGSIILETDRNTRYITEIWDKDGDAEVKSIPGRCLEAEGWLALGFPSLRSVTFERPKLSPLESKQRPTVEDLLTLVSGSIDYSANKLKEWLLNLDYQIKTEIAGSNVSKSEFYERQRAKLFELIHRITPGLAFEYAGINTRTYQINIRTADGVVPIEELSEGTTALIGWSSVLLRRMYDLYGDTENPLEHYALVLIDEIDGHMHPFWQKNIVPALREIFPNVQFVMATHAPLIVGGLRDCQVTKLSRNVQTGAVSAQQTRNNLYLMRADQILTSSLFGLGSTRADSMGRYTALLGKTDRTPAEQDEFENLMAQIEEGITTGESPLQRKVEIAVQEMLDREMRDIRESDSTEMPPSQISPDIAFEIRRQLANLMEPKF